MPVDQATVDRLRTHEWGADPFVATPGAAEPYRTRLVAGRCFFLDADNLCRIHRELSYDAKPRACKAFPLTVFELAGRSHARLSYWCPTVVANTGKPLGAQRRWLNETARHGDRRSAALTIEGSTPIGARDFEQFHQALRRSIIDGSLTMADRLAAAAAVVARVHASATRQGVDLSAVVREAESQGRAELARQARQGGRASGARRVFVLSLLADGPPGGLTHVGRVLSILAFLAGVSAFTSRTVGASARLRQVRRVEFRPSQWGDELLTRYFLSKVESFRYVAGGKTVTTGFNLLVGAYGVINLLARLRAAAAGRSSCDDEDLKAAVGAAEFLLVEHASLGKAQALLVEAALHNPSLCGDVLALLD